jgi:prephenate dehydrogenase
VGWNHNPERFELAERLGITCYNDISAVVAQTPDVIFVATPIYSVEGVFLELRDAGLSASQAVVDVASVKVMPQKWATQAGIAQNYVGAHPMFGTELTGLSNSSAALGDGAIWAVCSGVDSDLTGNIVDFIEQVLDGAAVLTTAEEHDVAVALSSHLPHVFAYELAGIISDKASSGDSALKLARKLNAGSFHGATRVAHGNPGLFRDMLKFNRGNISALLAQTIAELEDLKQSLQTNDDARIDAFIARSEEFRH